MPSLSALDPPSSILHPPPSDSCPPPSALRVRGHTDLAIGDRKFSGNAQRRKRNAVLFHGSFLLNFDIALIEKFLFAPSTQPAYRENRSHREFLTNLGADLSAIKEALQMCWRATEILKSPPLDRLEQLAAEKYASAAWTWNR